jgi:hypothetical protein
MRLMTDPSSSGAASRPVRRPRFHRRLVDRRMQLMAGRIGDFAADQGLRSLEWRLAAYLGAVMALVPIVILEGESHPLAGGIVAACAILWSLGCHAAFYRYGRAANLDIVRSVGLPDRSWRKVRANTPEQFDAWLSRAREQTAPSRPVAI